MTLANTVNLTPTASATTPTPTPPTGRQAIVFANDGGSPTVNFSASDPPMVGDTGSGGTGGNVPAPSAGDAAANKFLKADATWAVPSGGGGSSPSVGFNVATGAPASPAAPYVLAPSAGTVSHCYFVTLSSDGSTNLVFNLKKNGTSVLSGSSATVTAGTSAGTVSSFSLTSGSITVTQGDVWELDISGGTSNWTGAVQCY
jgi:hypothetical protein